MGIPDLSNPIFQALRANIAIREIVASYANEPAVFTRTPVPGDAPRPFILAAGDAAVTDQDFLRSPVAVIVRDITVYGHKIEDFRQIELCARLIRDLFHRQRFALAVDGWNVVDIIARGPIIGPAEADDIVSRVVTLTVRLCQS